ncbi:MAG: transposase, partial [Culicoidibacterales bacterium]
LAPYYWKPYFWSNSYLILSTGGATIDMIKKYIENQGQ